MMHTRLPLFWTITVARQGIDLSACQQHAGLAMMMGGNNAIARAFTGDQPFTKPVGEPTTIQLCETCMCDFYGTLLVLEESVRESLEAKKNPNPGGHLTAAASPVEAGEASGPSGLGPASEEAIPR